MAPVPKAFQPAALRRYPGKMVDLEAPMRVARVFERPMVLVQTKEGGNVVTIPIAPEELQREIDVQWRDYFPYELDRSGAFPEYVGPGQPIPGITGLGASITQTRRASMRGVGATIVQNRRKNAQPDQWSGAVTKPARRTDFTLIPSMSADQPTFARGTGIPKFSPAIPTPIFTPAYTRGTGAIEGEPSTMSAVSAGLILGLVLAGGYFAGAAMAPDPKHRVGWGIAGSALGFFTGPIGLGIMGLTRILKKG